MYNINIQFCLKKIREIFILQLFSKTIIKHMKMKKKTITTQCK